MKRRSKRFTVLMAVLFVFMVNNNTSPRLTVAFRRTVMVEICFNCYFSAYLSEGAVFFVDSHGEMSS